MNNIELKNYKEFVMLYNKMVSECFKSCITTFNEGRLTANEQVCVNECVNKMVNVNHRIMSVFMEIGPPADKEMGMGGSAGSLTR
ncbi:mitochondrial import inner membrane translocase subunit Tim10 B-like [Dendronephthya gigantea]|uniref:mitochondrial import inner membrane translocase subunit Tim10 B-like n=1 Tax=Dendronephthya gigantea TaxID=151771 RepID=UPI00106D20FE|nr:mitochondrial import inner membrane translocase subunit Tim10 B-like [Dendronephthya gigantea]